MEELPEQHLLLTTAGEEESWTSRVGTVPGLVPGDLVGPGVGCLVVVPLGGLQPVEWDWAIKLVVTLGHFS